MAITIASQADKALMKCIYDWYGQGKVEPARVQQDQIIHLITGRYASERPYAVIFAVIQKECGKFPSR